MVMFSLPNNTKGFGKVTHLLSQMCHGHPIEDNELYINVNYIFEETEHPIHKYRGILMFHQLWWSGY